VAALSQPFDLAGHAVHIGVSIGTTVYPDHARDVESLMRHADVAMYKAKEEGKNKVRYFSSELVEIVEKRQAMLSELRRALDNEELKVVYQPKLCLKENKILSCEALVRWTMPDGTVVQPSEFIPLAEDFGLIAKLGDQVFQIVCQQARQWHEAGILSGPIAVNLSPKQLKESGFLQRFVKIMDEAQIRPEWIELEITENAVMEDKDLALDLMHKLNDLGVSIAMDDFGTGYSSLSFIRDFPIRTLKIDTTFVKDLPDCSRAVAIAKTVLSLGHGLNLKVVAEGVEKEQQLDFLRQEGCDMAQGFLIHQPLSGDDYPRFVQQFHSG
jgi:EAL domain-containing protein (putative c-di-GMP-specific phosphodiesterase class I)